MAGNPTEFQLPKGVDWVFRDFVQSLGKLGWYTTTVPKAGQQEGGGMYSRDRGSEPIYVNRLNDVSRRLAGPSSVITRL